MSSENVSSDRPIVMIIEDSDVTRVSVQGLFEELGCEVIAKSTAEGAINRLESGIRPDVIILDMKLPGISGPSFFMRLQGNKEWKEIPVVPFSSQIDNNWINPKLFSEWMAVAKAVKIRRGSNLESMVSKGREGEDSSRIPDELVVTVADTLRKNNKSLPSMFTRMELKLKEEREKQK